jgi:hypothetical protein
MESHPCTEGQTQHEKYQQLAKKVPINFGHMLYIDSKIYLSTINFNHPAAGPYNIIILMK